MPRWLAGRRRIALAGAVAIMIGPATSVVLIRALLIPVGWDPMVLIVIQALITSLLMYFFFWLKG